MKAPQRKDHSLVRMQFEARKHRKESSSKHDLVVGLTVNLCTTIVNSILIGFYGAM